MTGTGTASGQHEEAGRSRTRPGQQPELGTERREDAPPRVRNRGGDPSRKLGRNREERSRGRGWLVQATRPPSRGTRQRGPQQVAGRKRRAESSEPKAGRRRPRRVGVPPPTALDATARPAAPLGPPRRTRPSPCGAAVPETQRTGSARRVPGVLGRQGCETGDELADRGWLGAGRPSERAGREAAAGSAGQGCRERSGRRRERGLGGVRHGAHPASRPSGERAEPAAARGQRAPGTGHRGRRGRAGRARERPSLGGDSWKKRDCC